MAIELRKILEIEADGSSDANPGEGIDRLNNKQFAVESIDDPNLGFRMWGGKDNAGKVTKWLAKDEDARVKNLGTENITISGVDDELDAITINASSSTVIIKGNGSIDQSSVFDLDIKSDRNINLEPGTSPGVDEIKLKGKVRIGPVDDNDDAITINASSSTVIIKGNGSIDQASISDLSIKSNNNINLETEGIVQIGSTPTVLSLDGNTINAQSGNLNLQVDSASIFFKEPGGGAIMEIQSFTSRVIIPGTLNASTVEIESRIDFTSETLSSPPDGTLWFDGTDLKFQVGSNTYTINKTLDT